MDPQSQAFVPSTNSDIWGLRSEMAKVQEMQAEHADRIARLERKQDEDVRVKSVWSNQSPFPSLLGGTPQQALQQPASDQFRSFDDDPNNMMSSLHLDADDEPRRGLGANSRANSVRFDETANMNYSSHSSRPSFEFAPSRTSSGLGALQMTERSSSHKSEGRASSVHSIRSAASGRANSVNDLGHSLGDSNRSPVDPQDPPPGLQYMGSVPAIIRCWMNLNFKHNAILYAAVCTGSHKSYIDMALIKKLGYEAAVNSNADGSRTAFLGMYFPEATMHPPLRTLGAVGNLPTIAIHFQVVEHCASEGDKSIQIFVGSDVLREHQADILFSANCMVMLADVTMKTKYRVPFVRPEDEDTFNTLFVSTGVPNAAREQSDLSAEESLEEMSSPNGIPQRSSGASVTSSTTSPPPGLYRPPATVAVGAEKATTTGIGSDGDTTAPAPSYSLRPSLTLLDTTSETQEKPVDPYATTPGRSGSNPAIWGNWRKDGIASAGPQQPAYQRREGGIKVLKPKSAARSFSSTGTASSATEAKSRFFGDDGLKGEVEVKEPASASKKSNPIGTGSAFSWLNPSGGAASK